MWTPVHWRIGFVSVLVVLGVLSGLLVFAANANNWVGVALTGGVMVGLYLSTAWTMRRLLGPLNLVVFGAAIPLATATGLIDNRALLPALVVAAVVFGIWYFIQDVWAAAKTNAEIFSDVVSLGEGNRSGRRAFVVYHPGRSGLYSKLQQAYAETLVENGWRVDFTTASSQTPVQLTDYDLLVLGAPTYNFVPAKPIVDYIGRIRNLDGKPVVLVLSGGGMTDAAMRRFHKLVNQVGGTVVDAVEVWVARTNLDRHAVADPLEVMRRAAVRLHGMMPADYSLESQ